MQTLKANKSKNKNAHGFRVRWSHSGVRQLGCGFEKSTRGPEEPEPLSPPQARGVPWQRFAQPDSFGGASLKPLVKT